MRILQITQFTPIHNISNKKQQNNNPNALNPITQNTTTRPVFAYQDFNISLRSRFQQKKYANFYERIS